MTFRALLRRAFPYLVIGIGGFALAYVIIFLFVLPSKIIPGQRTMVVTDSSTSLQPIDTAIRSDSLPPPVQSFIAARQQPLPQNAPDVVGMALPDARRILNNSRLRTVVERDTTGQRPPNTVLSQNPVSGSPLAAGAVITLTVSQQDSASLAQAKPHSSMTPILRADSDSMHRDTTQHPER